MNSVKPQPAVSQPPRAGDSPQRWHGALEGVHRGLVYGWAVDTLQPASRVVLELCLDDVAVASAIADVARTDLAARFSALLGGAGGDPCHGFVADLGALDHAAAGALTVRVANTGQLLPGHLAMGEEAKPALAATSMVFHDGGLRLHGWALDARDDKRAVRVRAFLGQHEVAHAVADLDLPTLRAHAPERHGFTLDLPLALADGGVHSVRVVDDGGAPLNGSPLTVCCHAGGMRALTSDANPLLATVADSYERYLPRSVGLEQYAAWSALFGSAALPAPAPSSLHTGLILCGHADPAATERTLASLRGQAGVKLTVFQGASQSGQPAAFGALVAAALRANCEVITTVRSGDTLAPHALARALAGFSLDGAELVYSDSEAGGQPWFKPAWDPDYALASDYPLDFMMVRAALVRRTLGVSLPDSQAAFGWQCLAAAWPSADRAIVHVPHVLYTVHGALSDTELAQRDSAARHALATVEPDAALEDAAGCAAPARRIRRPLAPRERDIKVSLIIPTRDHADMLARCIDSIARHTAWPQLEIIVIDNGSVEAATRRYFSTLAKQGIKVLPMPGPFNFAQLNNDAVLASSGEIIGLINNDIEALHDGWLDELVGQLLRPGVGAVGAKLLWPNGMVQHGGVVLGVGNVAGHFGNRLADADWGDHGRNQLQQRVSAVTAACLLLRKQDFMALGGMDAAAFPVAFNDVDLCLRLRAAGHAIAWTPFAKLLHAESVSRGQEDTPQKRARAQREVDRLRQRWGAVLTHDPAYHPSLNLDPHSQAFGGLALPPRERRPRRPLLTALHDTSTSQAI